MWFLHKVAFKNNWTLLKFSEVEFNEVSFNKKLELEEDSELSGGQSKHT